MNKVVKHIEVDINTLKNKNKTIIFCDQKENSDTKKYRRGIGY